MDDVIGGDGFELVAAVLLLAGAVLSLAAGVGLVRFPDALSRMHAATKPQILGLICVLVGVVLASHSWSALLVVVVAILLQLLTSPMSAHMIGRAGYRTGNYRRDLLERDELEDDIKRASD
ncbi:monovalent cation/H(+) antiporter subunit G [Amnibacterium flavum]|uniref:Sodium:proton antiporter n=1 Tax=Amnibacterium flavum TaxID=2173173 RepID=A0A2V1HTT4_9MICO|nr:monovalent cation/H(+) antiporter subunit G [Amnibacterium flavum]PVZ95978.1 sodium:proton antiporter [Amnibacterium flavum]